jgi:hypothetical protein
VNGATIKLALYTRDLLGVPESTIVLGRTNRERGDTTILQIVIDSLAPATPLDDTSKYDSVNEVMEISQTWQAVMTIDFMGSSAYTEAMKFITRNRHQVGFDLKRALGIDIGAVSQLQDLKLKQGEQYSERYQLQVTMTYNVKADIETLRIETAQLDTILTN